jgi:tetratricopeptide (TPR) repeat protein
MGAEDTGIFKKYSTLRPSIDKARATFLAGQFDAAQVGLAECLKKVPDHFEAHFLLSQIGYAEKNFTKALEHIEVAEQSLAKLEAINQRQIENMKHSNDELRRTLQASLDEIDARTGGAYGCGGNDVGEMRSTLSSLDREGSLLQTDGLLTIPANYHFVHGNCLFQLGRHAEARQQYLAATKADPAYAEAWSNLINLMFIEKDFIAATRTLNQVEVLGIKINPKLKQAVLEAKP